MGQRDLKGKRYLALLRCSSKGQADTSIDDQRKVIDAFAREHGMVRVDEVALEGVSGSIPGLRSDIDLIVDRKMRDDDFEVVIIHDFSRLTRAGAQHASSIRFALGAAGIDLVSATDNIPEGDDGELFAAFIDFANKRHAQSISFGATRGAMSALLDNRSTYCRRPPYGIDRLYLGSDGRPLHIIRNLPDKTQVMLHPETKDVLRTFQSNDGRGGPNHYRKQKQDRVALVLGDERQVEVVRQIYRRAHVDNWGAWRIALELNSQGVPSPNGGKWSMATVRHVLLDPIYLGTGIANRYSTAIYNMRSKDCPVATKPSKQELATRKRPAQRIRPREEWHFQSHPALNDLLPLELRELAAARQEAYLGGQAIGRMAKPNRDRHRDSSFFLKEILRSKQGDFSMSGTITGKNYRYYRVGSAYKTPDPDKSLRKLIPAEPLEKAVLALVQSTLTSTPNLRELIDRQVRAQVDTVARDNLQLEKHYAERETIRKQLTLVMDHFDPAMKELVAEKLGELQAQLRTVNDRIARCELVAPADETAIEQMIDETVAAVSDVGQMMGNAPPALIHRYLRLFVGSLVVDLETKDVDLEIRLPLGAEAEGIPMCLVDKFAYKISNETHCFSTPPIAVFRLMWDKKARQYLTIAPHVDPYTDGIAA